jgi:L-amino acid N-acyltransferase YncA
MLISKQVAETSARYLNPTSWRKGFGKLLCNTAIDELRKSGYHEVTLWGMAIKSKTVL